MKKLVALSILFSILLSYGAGAKISPVQLQCEYLVDPSVIDVLNPRLSWVNVADKGEQGQRQTRCRPARRCRTWKGDREQ